MQELQTAEIARADEKEGKARVCARRAAGIAIGEYFQRLGIQPVGSSAYDRLRALLTLPGISPAVEEVCQHLLVRVTPDHTLPVEADLVSETRWLVHELLGEEV